MRISDLGSRAKHLSDSLICQRQTAEKGNRSVFMEQDVFKIRGGKVREGREERIRRGEFGGGGSSRSTV